MTPRTEPEAAGFTLVEILVAITLLGLLMAALFGGVQLGVRAWESSEAEETSHVAPSPGDWRHGRRDRRPVVAEGARGAQKACPSIIGRTIRSGQLRTS